MTARTLWGMDSNVCMFINTDQRVYMCRRASVKGRPGRAGGHCGKEKRARLAAFVCCATRHTRPPHTHSSTALRPPIREALVAPSVTVRTGDRLGGVRVQRPHSWWPLTGLGCRWLEEACGDHDASANSLQIVWRGHQLCAFVRFFCMSSRRCGDVEGDPAPGLLFMRC